MSLTVSAMRAAADLIETAGVTGLSVTCSDTAIDIQVSRHAHQDPQARVGVVAALAEVLDGAVTQDDDHHRQACWLRANGQAAGLPVRVWTALQIPADAPDGALAQAPDGRVAATGSSTALPLGWRPITELDAPDLSQVSQP